MSNDEEVQRILKMDMRTLLAYIVAWPEYLTDPYYREFGRAIERRTKELLA
jgi:hypothetical protein